MWNKLYWIIVFLGLIVGVFYYFALNKSFMLSFKAKELYYQGEYEEALELAKVAYQENSYNRMAFTVVVQSQKSLEWQKYIKESKEYLIRSKFISEKPQITQADKNEIKLMSEIVIGGYKVLDPKNTFISEEIKQEAKYYYKEFKNIYDQLYK